MNVRVDPRLRTAPGVDDVARECDNYTGFDGQTQREMLTGLLQNLLVRQEIVWLSDVEGGEAEMARSPYGGPTDERENRIRYVAQELGAVIAQLDGNAAVIITSRGPYNARTAFETPPGPDSAFESTRIQAQAFAHEAMGFQAMEAAFPNDQFRRQIAREHQNRATELLANFQRTLAEHSIASQFPTFSPAATAPYRNRTFTFRRTHEHFSISVTDGGETSHLAEVSSAMARTRWLDLDQRPPMDSTVPDVRRYDGERAYEDEGKTIGLMSMAVMCSMGLNITEATALTATPTGVGFETTATGFTGVIQEIWGNLRRGRPGDSITLSGEKLADWIDSCNASFSGQAVMGKNTSPLPPGHVSTLAAPNIGL